MSLRKRVYFNASIINDNPTGLGVYAINILKGLIRLNIVDGIIYYDNMKMSQLLSVLDGIDKIKMSNDKQSIFLKRYNYMKIASNVLQDKNTIIYSPTAHGVTSGKGKQIITVHDLLPLLYPQGRKYQYIYHKIMLPNIIKFSEKIVTVSENTKRDLIKQYNLPKDKIEVISNGYIKHQEVSADENKKYVFNKYTINKYLLMVGIHYKYKNLHRVIQAFYFLKDIIDNELVIVGKCDNSYGNELKELVNRLGLGKRIKFLGYIPDDDLKKIYSGAEVFIYPSLYEGFGIPLLEAMSYGVPVICSNTSSLPEVGGNAPLYFDPLSVDDIKVKLEKMIMYSNEDKQQYVEKGFLNIEKFNWDSSSEKLANIINSI